MIGAGFAQIPRTMNYQGKLTGTDGVALEGAHDIAFYLMRNLEPASDLPGDTLWAETLTVSINKGLFDALLGEAHPIALSFNVPYYMELIVDGETMSPREKLAAVGYAHRAIYSDTAAVSGGSASIPSGVIVMWSGLLANIPPGWALCDGTMGTPDLRDKFIYGVSALEEPGATGGASTYSLTVAQLPAHTHTGTTNTDGAHVHNSYMDNTFTPDIGVFATITPDYVLQEHYIYSGNPSTGAHSHSFTTNSAGSGAIIDNRPAYFKLAFIMKL